MRDNLFYGLAYGLEEMRYLNKKNQFDPKDIRNAKDLVKKTQEEISEYVKVMTLEIEANMYHRFLKDVRKGSDYSQRSKAIAMNLKHSQNFELRKSVLAKLISAADLCTMPEEDLAPQASRKLINA